jgi:hypothetical protein
MAITTAQRLLTKAWTADVQALEGAIGRFTSGRRPTNDCRVVFFEIARDAHLHVNVTHRHETRTARGWTGPAALPEGFVHNRMFGDASPKQIVRTIRSMVFAAEI